MSDIKKDIEELEKLTAAANASLGTSAITLTANSSGSIAVAPFIGGATGATLATGGISAIAGSSIGGAALLTTGSIGGGAAALGTAGALGAALAGGPIIIIIAALIGILTGKWLFGEDDDEKKLKMRLKEAVETQNRLLEKIKELTDQFNALKQDYEAQKKAFVNKMNELLAINFALVEKIKYTQKEYNV